MATDISELRGQDGDVTMCDVIISARENIDRAYQNTTPSPTPASLVLTGMQATVMFLEDLPEIARSFLEWTLEDVLQWLSTLSLSRDYSSQFRGEATRRSCAQHPTVGNVNVYIHGSKYGLPSCERRIYVNQCYCMRAADVVVGGGRACCIAITQQTSLLEDHDDIIMISMCVLCVNKYTEHSHSIMNVLSIAEHNINGATLLKLKPATLGTSPCSAKIMP